MKNSTGDEVVPTTPLMLQYYSIKKQHPDAILLFRVGDFYETFGQDAVKTAQALGIVLTNRNNGSADTELAGFPHHSLDMYLPRLVKAGYRVAICDQLEKPSKEKKIVKRGVTDVVTPGLALDDKLLDHRSNNYLASVYKLPNEHYGIGLLDVSTGEFLVSEGELPYLSKLLQSFVPSEVIMPKSQLKDFTRHFGDSFYSYGIDEWVYTEDNTRELLLNHFQVTGLKGFGIEEMGGAKIAAGAVLHYLHTSEKKELGHINSIARLANDKYVWLDRFTIRNLELVHSQNVGGVPLINVLDQTITPMGSRMMKKWITLPLLSKIAIDSRLSQVSYFLYEADIAENVEAELRQIGDLERIVSKVAMGRISPREVVQLKRALDHVKPVKEMLLNSGLAELQKSGDSIHDCKAIRAQISAQLNEDAPSSISKGSVIKSGFNAELDELVNLMNNSKEILLEIQQTEAEKTGISGLKIGFNNVFGYYLEVTNKYKDQGLVPDDWIRKQTLTGAERYITNELKILETKILGAEEKITELEEKLFLELVEEIQQYIMPVQHNAQVIAKLDCILSFARVARKNRYVKPVINDSLLIDIKEGRHPVIETIIP
ncbi:MAG TPA: DNA mismatch repair protein MutS, partial [Saprospiraceae bacterium]|nr:DNA mismatch repair protein MutS [Saprospiraceae bacterium]